jgi:hypothetical protein
MEEKTEILVGRRYRHYKGTSYLVLNLGVCTEGGEDLVVYTQCHGDTVWVRPAGMWFDEVTQEGGAPVRRFELEEELSHGDAGGGSRKTGAVGKRR